MFPIVVAERLLAHLLREWDIETPSVLWHDFGAATALRGYFLNGLRYCDHQDLRCRGTCAVGTPSPSTSPLEQALLHAGL